MIIGALLGPCRQSEVMGVAAAGKGEVEVGDYYNQVGRGRG